MIKQAFIFSAFVLFTGIGLSGASLQEQIDDAEPGVSITLPAGEHPGPITITKPISLIGEPGATIVGDGQSSVITILADDVRIEGLRVVKSGRRLEKDQAAIYIKGRRARIKDNLVEQSLHGIYLREAHDSIIEGNTIIGQTTRQVPLGDPLARGIEAGPDGLCTIVIDPNQRGNGIHLWNSTGNQLLRNVIRDTRDGIYFSFSHETFVSGNYITHVRYGLHYMYSDFNIFEGNRFEMNAAGAAIMYSEGLLVRANNFSNNDGYRAYGILLTAVDDTTFLDNTLSHNTVGLYIENSNRNTLRGNSVDHNYVGIRMNSSSQTNRFTENRFLSNLHSVEVEAGGSPNEWAVDGRGNVWQDAHPIDLNGDGAGELPYRQTDLLGQYRREFPPVGLLSDSPLLKVLSFIHSRTPLPGVNAIEDPAPLARSSRKPPEPLTASTK